MYKTYKYDLAIAADGQPLQPGQMRVAATAIPRLPAGKYQIQATQTVDGLDDALLGADVQPPAFRLQQPMTVIGSRFQLETTDVQQVYPPARSEGNYNESFPHVVLRRRTLPWERNPAETDSSTKKPDPWLAVILFSEDELEKITPKTVTVQDLLNQSDPTILAPSLNTQDITDETKKQRLNVIDVDYQLFLDIAPTQDDLPYLSHVREVNTDGKEILGMEEDGWFSVVAGNRLCRPPAGSAEVQSNKVFLVSVEGHLQNLPATDAKDMPKAGSNQKIRLVNLAAWTFNVQAVRGNFLDIVENLQNRGGVDLLQANSNFAQPTAESLYVDYTAYPGTPEEMAQMAIKIGAVPLPLQTRSGETTTAWYHGPFVAQPTDPTMDNPELFSDGAIQYDPATGMFDMSYATAWQIGRLLALSDASFARQLLAWRRGLKKQAAQNLRKQALAASLLGRDVRVDQDVDVFAHLAKKLKNMTRTPKPEVRRVRDRIGETRQQADLTQVKTQLRTGVLAGLDPLDEYTKAIQSVLSKKG